MWELIEMRPKNRTPKSLGREARHLKFKQNLVV